MLKHNKFPHLLLEGWFNTGVVLYLTFLINYLNKNLLINYFSLGILVILDQTTLMTKSFFYFFKNIILKLIYMSKELKLCYSLQGK